MEKPENRARQRACNYVNAIRRGQRLTPGLYGRIAEGGQRLVDRARAVLEAQGRDFDGELRRVTMNHAAEQLGVPYSTIRLLVDNGKLSGLKAGRKTLVDLNEARQAAVAHERDPNRHRRPGERSPEEQVARRRVRNNARQRVLKVEAGRSITPDFVETCYQAGEPYIGRLKMVAKKRDAKAAARRSEITARQRARAQVLDHIDIWRELEHSGVDPAVFVEMAGMIAKAFGGVQNGARNV